MEGLYIKTSITHYLNVTIGRRIHTKFQGNLPTARQRRLGFKVCGLLFTQFCIKN